MYSVGGFGRGPNGVPGKTGPVVTVAELMRRCAPRPPSPTTTPYPIPVAALLRREGRSAEGLPRCRRPPSARSFPPSPCDTRSCAAARSPRARSRGGLGLRAHRRLHVPATPPSSSGVYPDEGLLFPTSPSGAALDAGNAAPTSWLPVAFPTAYARPWRTRPPQTSRPPARRSRRQPRRPAGGQVAAPAAAARRARPATSTGGVVGQTATPAAWRQHRGRRGRTVTVGDTVGELGKGTPLEGVTKPLGGTVSGLGQQPVEESGPLTPQRRHHGQLGAVRGPITTPPGSPLDGLADEPAPASEPSAKPKPSWTNPARHRPRRRSTAPPRAVAGRLSGRRAAGPTPSATARTGWRAGSCARPRHVRLDRFHRDEQLGRDLLVGVAAGKEPQYVSLAAGEQVELGITRRGGARPVGEHVQHEPRQPR